MFSYRGINARPLATILWTRQHVTSAWLCLKLGVAKCPCTPTRLGTQKAHKHKHFMGISLPNMGYSRPMCPTPMSVLSETPADSTDADGQLPLRIASFSGLCGVRGICLLRVDGNIWFSERCWLQEDVSLRVASPGTSVLSRHVEHWHCLPQYTVLQPSTYLGHLCTTVI